MRGVEDIWIFPNPNKVPLRWTVASKIITGLVGITSKLFSDCLTTVRVHNREILHRALTARDPGQGLLTVCNHHSCIDDPLLWGMTCTWGQLLNNDLIRHSPAARDICFKKRWHNILFSLGKVVPIVRGEGVYQRPMDYVGERLNSGKWAHMFPEGKVNMTKMEFLRLKWGVGRLIAECDITPVVLPIWHIGMDSILPNYTYVPQIFKKVTVFIGEPIDFSNDVENMKRLKKTPTEMRKYLTDRIQEEFWLLREKAEAMHSSNFPSSER